VNGQSIPYVVSRPQTAQDYLDLGDALMTIAPQIIQDLQSCGQFNYGICQDLYYTMISGVFLGNYTEAFQQLVSYGFFSGGDIGKRSAGTNEPFPWLPGFLSVFSGPATLGLDCPLLKDAYCANSTGGGGGDCCTDPTGNIASGNFSIDCEALEDATCNSQCWLSPNLDTTLSLESAGCATGLVKAVIVLMNYYLANRSSGQTLVSGLSVISSYPCLIPLGFNTTLYSVAG